VAEALSTSEKIFRTLLAHAGSDEVAMRSWTGDLWGSADAPAVISLKHPGSLRALLLPPNDLVAGEAYIYDDIDIEGDILAAVSFGEKLQSLRSDRKVLLRLVPRLLTLPRENRRSARQRPVSRGRLHSKTRDSVAVTAHYNTGNEFFSTFLDPLMVYSCAAFLRPDEPLLDAQRRKLDLICAKLQLRAGQRLLDVGCGWGALAIHAAEHYGVETLGITLSAPQAELASMRAKEAMVEDRVRFEVMDYRDVTGSFDAISSVGMFEHVGKGQLERYFTKVAEVLEPDGVFLNHGIVNRDRTKTKTTPTFVNTYVFPDGELIPVDEVIGAAEDAGFELRDTESLRTSYALTLRHWVHNLERRRTEAIGFSDETTYRIWRLYMAASSIAFERAGIGLYQLLFRRPDRPWTFGRSHLIAADDH